MHNSLKENCGIFGVSLEKPSIELTRNLYLGLFALQHRGQESCGIAYKKKDVIELLIRQGLITGNFFKSLPVNMESSLGIGHVRYSTTGASNLVNAQPFIFKCNKGEIAIAHNGNIPGAQFKMNELIQAGSIFKTTSDSEILIHLLARIPGSDFKGALFQALGQLSGAYSMLLMHENTLAAFRDPLGFRPLCYGRLDNGYAFASETNALDLVGAEYVDDVAPGEIIFCQEGRLEKERFAESKNVKQCIFELIYFSRPDSFVFKESVHEARIKMGRKLAERAGLKPDIAIAVPDSGNSSALGFARASGIPFEIGLIRNHYTGRTFIKPGQNMRDEGVKIKLNPIKSVVNNKKIAIIDDSIVRGTTASKIVKLLRNAGAKEVHFFLSSPEIKYSCFYGIDTPTRQELISSNNSPKQIAELIGADSVNFLQIEDLKKCVMSPEKYCYACFDGSYPIKADNCSGCRGLP